MGNGRKTALSPLRSSRQNWTVRTVNNSPSPPREMGALYSSFLHGLHRRARMTNADAKLKLARANEHLRGLDPVLRAFGEAHSDAFTRKDDIEQQRHVLTAKIEPVPVW